MKSEIQKPDSLPLSRNTIVANGHKSFVRRYGEFMMGVLFTMGFVVYFTQLPISFARKSQVTALETKVNTDSAKTDAVVKQVKRQSSQAADSAAEAKVAAQQAQTAADVVAAHRLFMTKRTEQQINDLDMRERSLARQLQTDGDRLRALEQRR